MARHRYQTRLTGSQRQANRLNSPSAEAVDAKEDVDHTANEAPVVPPQDQQDDDVQPELDNQSSHTPAQGNEVSQLAANSIAPTKGKRRNAKADASTPPPTKKAKTSTAKKTTSGSGKSKANGSVKSNTSGSGKSKSNSKSKAKGETSPGGGGGDLSEATVEVDLPPSTDKPLYELREIIADLLERSQNDGLNHYVGSGRQYFIRVGTLCSGTDAPVHVMNLFGMLKNDQGNQVFTTINSFGCEIEPFKQGFLMRNSKPQLLFRDAKDFAENGAHQAHLVTGTKATIPHVDLFIAGTSCVDFSTLNTKKTKAFKGLATEANAWERLHHLHEEKLTRRHLSHKSWRKAIDAMMDVSGSGNTSTTTFASAINYVYEHQPSIIIFENVESAPWESVAEYVLPLCGYAAAVMKLDTKSFYLPQTRSRKYLVAFSHAVFTLQGAQALTKAVVLATDKLKRMHSSFVTEFLLPLNSLELHRARNEMELIAQAKTERDPNWTFSQSRHTAFRRQYKLPDTHPWMKWKFNGSSSPPAKMFKSWVEHEPRRVKDVLDCLWLFARYGASLKHGRYDITFKAQIIDCSQNVDRLDIKICFGRTGCITPSAIPVLTLEARPLTGSESLKLQGLPIENFDMSIETQEQLQDLAGNAMSTTVVGATILAVLQCVAKMAKDEGFDWMETMFRKGDFEDVQVRLNSFQNDGANLDHGSREELSELKISAQLLPRENVQEILDLGQQTRRRCYCYHNLTYSSLELYECVVCHICICKSCKGNPAHQMVKLQQSFEQIRSLPFSKAEHAIRQYFPSVLPFVTSFEPSSVERLEHALLGSDYNASQKDLLANVILRGLCQSIYQLRFVEITDVTRIEYIANPEFILRVIVEKDKIVWYLHLNEWCDMAEGLRGTQKTNRPIARAVIEPHHTSQFPWSWEFWIPKKVEFSLNLRVGADRQLRLEQVGDLQNIPRSVQQPIKILEQSVWTNHQECGYPEDAFWVCDDGEEKLWIFKDVDPVGPADKDEFVITSTSREMGRAPVAETRPVLLRIHAEDQIHLMIKGMVANNEDENVANIGDSIPLRAFVDGWWEDLEAHRIRVNEFTGNINAPWLRDFPVSPPVDIRLPNGNYDPSGPFASCHAYQDLLTMSLPIMLSSETLEKTVKTIRDLDLTQQLDFAEFEKHIGPCYFAVEQEITKLGRHRVLQKDVVLTVDCARDALKIPDVFFEKAEKTRGIGARSLGPVIAKHRPHQRDAYNNALQARPSALRIDHIVDPAPTDHPKKLKDVNYIDVRFVAHGHSLLHQARSFLPSHPAYFRDSTETRGSFAFEVGVLEDPRLDLSRIEIMSPATVSPEDARQPEGFRDDIELFPEQINSLHWMLERESLQNAPGFVEKEVAEVYVDQLRLRVYAHAERNIVRRGRVVADDVGFGKTAVCLGLIACQHDTDRNEFLDMRRNNPYLREMCHLHATLVIVPNQLTQQWHGEVKRFLQTNNNILIIQDFRDLQQLRPSDLQEADIIICSSKVMHGTGERYHRELLNYCGAKDIETRNLMTLPRVYRAWYNAVHEVLQFARGDALDVSRVSYSGKKADKEKLDVALDFLKVTLDQIRRNRRLNGDEFRFAPPEKHSKNWKPVILLEFFSFARLIWDEFPYENLPVAEFVAHCATSSKWMLSGTPPLTTLGDICKVAYLFNVHVARPISMLMGRQPVVCNHAPLEPLSDLETTDSYKSRNSPPALLERHEQAKVFVKVFMRKNTRDVELRAIESPLVLTTSTNCSLTYVELQQELISRTFNANIVAAECRRRLMSLVDWFGSKLGRERSIEALMIRGSGSFQDVKEQSGNLELRAAASTVEEAEELYNISVKTIEAMVDRGRELFGKAFFLGYRLTFITITNTKEKAKDNQEERQLNYYKTLKEMVGTITGASLRLTSGWDAFESTARMLILTEHLDKHIHQVKELPSGDAAKNFMQASFDLNYCKLPETIAVPDEQPAQEDRLKLLGEKQEYLELFRVWLTKTPLHSRRTYLVDKIAELDEAEKELLEIEWKDKVPWEAKYAATNDPSKRKAVIPISELEEPSSDVEIDAFNFDQLRATDRKRRDAMEAITEDIEKAKSKVDSDIESRPHKGRKDTKVFWGAECLRRGLQNKAADSLATLQKRVVADEAGIATDSDYLSPESCPIAIEDFPEEGTIRVRGGTMEDIFDRFMHTVDKLTSLHERLTVAHAKKNLQKVVLDLVRGVWTCDKNLCDGKPRAEKVCHKTDAEHYVSLQCGHVLCEPPEPKDDAKCGVRGCTNLVQDVCIPLLNILEKKRVIKAADLEEGALTKDPDEYLGPGATSHGPKATAIANLIESVEDTEQVVVFVQCAPMMKDLYGALESAGISHIEPEELERDEAKAIENFKEGGKKVLIQVMNSEQAAGSNLHNANHVVFMSPLISRGQADWDAQMKQALGRCVRYRQNKTVYVYHMLMDGTIEVDTLEWRRKREVVARRGLAVGRFNDCSTLDFLARFERDAAAAAVVMAEDEDRAISLIPRGDIQVLMGDDYISLASVRSKTVENAIEEQVIVRDEEDDVQMGEG